MATSPATAPVHADRRRLFVVHPVDQHPRHRRHASGQVRHQKSVGRDTVGLQTASGIETEPAEPQKSRSHEYESNVVRAHRLSDPVASSLTEQHGHYQCGNTGIDMHDRSARKVDGPHFLQPSAAPYPVRHRVVHQAAPQDREEHKARKFDPFGKSAQYQSRRDHGKHTLENHENDFGNVARSQRRRRYAVQHHFIETADHAACGSPAKRGSEYETVTECHPQNTTYADDKQALHNDAQYVFLAHQPAVKQGDTGNGHQQDEDGSDDHPRRVAAVHRRTATCVISSI